MSIIKAIERAYQIKEERNWDTIYWCIDLHGTCIKSNYVSGEYEWINEDAKQCLQLIASLFESKIIIWSSCYSKEWKDLCSFFNKHNVAISWINSNPNIENTETGCFDDKFYFSVGIDDKFGFDSETDWREIYEYLNNRQWK